MSLRHYQRSESLSDMKEKYSKATPKCSRFENVYTIFEEVISSKNQAKYVLSLTRY